MGYIIPSDYLPLIQDVNLTQIINSNTSVRKAAERAAEAEAVSFLRQKYDTTAEIKDTTQWDKTAPYSAYDRVYLDATAFAASANYAVGDFSLYNGNVYECITPAHGAFVESEWTLVGAQYDIYYALPPYPAFDLYKVYKVGDKVFYKNSVYTCLIETILPTHETTLQYRLKQNTPALYVIYVDDVVGATHWSFDEAYIVPANTDVNNAVYWSDTDNRDQQMVQKFVEITLFHLHKRIAPRNIPALRIEAYMGAETDRAVVNGEIRYPVYSALGWLQACGRGEVTPRLPLIQPKQGNRIRFGGGVRNINSY